MEGKRRGRGETPNTLDGLATGRRARALWASAERPATWEVDTAAILSAGGFDGGMVYCTNLSAPELF